ncbi:unnamed protein product [Rhizoctonia solani]|uniref:Protein kinase domain-containing protein n=1 Tax=Rhizoctonia solani TaxID=456999 RepID=A0A8H3ATS6_9AGAM|nr:unnamed protein product [Rhizoctonia solani]
MARIYSSPLWSRALGATSDITKFVQVSRVGREIYEEAGLGGSADIFSGAYTNPDGGVTRVAIKCIRAFNMGKDATEQMKHLHKKLLRELGIWLAVSGGDNIIKLLGIMEGIGPLPAFVCELCPWNLQDYLERKTPPPRHTKMMTDTLRGLSYMHSLESGPIAHGDVKLNNILVDRNENALICDFGRSRQPGDQPNEATLSSSSPFAGTVRYMSPELLRVDSARPSPAADMWAYGCIALEILCRIQPYHETTSNVMVAELIRSGRPPSDRPRGPRATLINDTLWNALSSCWQAQDWRPTAHGFLEELTRMLHRGEIPRSPVLMNAFQRTPDEPVPSWPHEIEDLSDQLDSNSFIVISRSLRSTVWLANGLDLQDVAVKVPRLNASLDNQARHDQLEYIFRKMASSRHGVRHPNIVSFLGITSDFSPHEGLVFEVCFEWNLIAYFKDQVVVQENYTRSTDPYPTTHSIMCDILEGLRYMHSYPIPIPQGDLTPENISVDIHGQAKISVISFGRILAGLPQDVAVTATIESVPSSRWMSPELLLDGSQQPTTESDMWAFGCICFWILTRREPYASIHRDDLAGAEIIRGRPPATLTNVFYRSTWITNGLWNHIGRCWRRDPLMRPSATEFLRFLVKLEGRTIPWLPVDVVDLTGKIRFNPSQRQQHQEVARYCFVWNFSRNNPEIIEETRVELALYETTYVPKWYSKITPVIVKAGDDYPTNTTAREALYSITQHEVALVSQIDHPCIQGFLGINSSPTHTHMLDMIFESLSPVTLEILLSQSRTSSQERLKVLRDAASALIYLHEHANGSIAHGNIHPSNIFVLSDGTTKLANFTCAFQYTSGQPASSSHLSETAAIPERLSLYSPPEYRDRFAFPTLAADIWSFGVIILSVSLMD